MPDLLQSLAIMTVGAGNAGITPFLSLFTLSALGQTGGGNTAWLSEPSSFGALLVLTLVEFVVKCIPALDSFVDQAMTFIVPFVSCISVIATMPEELESEGRRLLDGGGSGFDWLLVAQILLLSFAVVLSVVIHLTKLLVRLAGVGWLTSTLTVIESVFVAVSTVAAVYIRPLSLVFALIFLLVLMKWVFARLETVWKSTRKRCKRKKRGSLLG